MRAPVACGIALRIAGAVGISAGSPTPLAPNGPSGSGSSIRMDSIGARRRGRDQIVVQVVGAAGVVFLHQRHADALCDAALDLALHLRGIDRAADVVGGVHLVHIHRAEFEVHFDLGELSGEPYVA